MPATVINPNDGDDLSAASITANVTDKMVAWEGSHETGLTTNGAVRHLSDQIDDVALPESAVPSSAGVTGSGTGVHARLDMFAVVLSAMMGTSGTGYAAKYTQLASLTYGSLNAISTALSSGASAAAGAGTLVRRAADGSANFAGTVGVVALAGTGNWATTGSITAVGATFSGVIVAGSGARQVTTADGHLDASQLTGALAAAAMPALTGDIVSTVGTVATTVSTVGGKSAAQVASAVTSTLAASSTGVGNHGAIAKYDVSGGMTFDAAVTAPTFVGSATTVADGAITATKIATYAITRLQLSEGSVVAQATPNKTVQVAPYYYYNSANVYGTPPGVSPAIDAVNSLPSAGQQRYDLLYTDDAFGLGWLAGTPASSSPAKPTLLVGATAKPLAWAGPITSATTAITAAMLFDARPSPASGGSSGSGGGGGAPTGGFYVTIGIDPTLTAETDIFTLGAGTASGIANGKDLSQYINHPRASKLDYRQAGLDRILSQFVSQNAMLSLQASGAALQLTVLNGPIQMGTNGIWNEIIATTTTGNTAGSAGMYKLVATLSAIATAPTLRLTQGSPLTSEIELANCYWDGTNWQLYVVWWPAFQQIVTNTTTPNGLPRFSSNTAGGGVTSASYAPIPTAPPPLQTIFLPTPMYARVRYVMNASPSVSPLWAEVILLIDGSGATSGIEIQNQGAASLNTYGSIYESPSPLAIGQHTFQLQARNNTASSTMTLSGITFAGEFFR